MTYSLQRLLIILGLVFIPFYEIFLRLLPFVANHAPDSREPKEIIALVFALSIGLLAVFQGTVKPFRNKFLLFIPVYLLFNLIIAPHASLFANNVDAGDFYFWKPFAEVLCFALMIIAISSIEINVEEILKIMTICGTVMAGYVILQNFRFDQFWIAKPFGFGGAGGAFTSVRAEALGGNLGQPTIVASWMVMMVPLAIYLRKWWSVALISIACLLTQGAMVIMALGVIGIGFLMRFHRKTIVPVIVLFLTFIVIVGLFHSLQQKMIGRSDGRWAVWQEVIGDMKTGQIQGVPEKFPFTGEGFGRFACTFPIKHNSQFQQAHNDSLQFADDCGLIGITILFIGLGIMIINVAFNFTPLSFSVFMSFITIFFCSLGSFPFQLGAHQFYASVLVGFLNNDSLIRGKV